MGNTIGQRVDIADVTGSAADDGEVRVNLGYDEVGISKDSPAWGWDGFVSRPNDPTEDGSALAFYIQDANEKFVIAMKDNRFADKVGTLGPGDRAIITDGEARIFVKKERDAVTLYTVNQNEDLSMMIDMAGVEGIIRMMNGNSYMVMENDKITMGINGGGVITIDGEGVEVRGMMFRAATSSGHLGAMPGVPYTLPPAPANSILYGPVGAAGIAAPKWTVSPL